MEKELNRNLNGHVVFLMINSILLSFWKKGDGNDRLGFICSVDIGGREVPDSWDDALEFLHNDYANAMVIRALPEILHYKVVIVTVSGVG